MKLGISYFPKHNIPEEWALILRSLGCTAAVCPISGEADDNTIAAYREAAEKTALPLRKSAYGTALLRTTRPCAAVRSPTQKASCV